MNVLLLLLVITPPLSALRWDLMVASEDHLQAVLDNGTVEELRAQKPFGSLMGLALDPKSQRVFFSSQNDEDASIFEFSYAKENSSFVPIIRRQSDPVLGLAYDPITATLFWTTGQSIMMLKIDESTSSRKDLSSGKPFLHFKQEKPQGIFVDSCGGYVYWTNSNSEPSIERARVSGEDHEKVISRGLFRPHSVTVDPVERRLYWGNEREDIFFVIESANLDGSDRKVLLRSVNNRPFSIAVNKDKVFWADWTNEAVWSIEKNGKKNDPKRVFIMQARQPMGMVSNAQDAPVSEAQCEAVMDALRRRDEDATAPPPATTTDAALGDAVGELADAEDVSALARGQYCLNSGLLSKSDDGVPVCRCIPGFSGPRCEVDHCHNLCVNGECEVNSTGAAVCRCQAGFSGSRCESSACAGFCMNDGCCKLVDGLPKCKCSSPFSGSRCELNSGYSKLCRIYCERSRDVSSLDGDDHPPCNCEDLMVSPYEYKVDSESRLKPSDDQIPLFSNASLALIATLSALCVFLLLCVLYLVRRVLILRKRPRIKRQFIGNKHPANPTPLTDRPTPAADICEISIENCCNMNICETPCFEPNLRTVRPGSKKEEKKTLLSSMEQGNGPSDDLY